MRLHQFSSFHEERCGVVHYSVRNFAHIPKACTFRVELPISCFFVTLNSQQRSRNKMRFFKSNKNSSELGVSARTPITCCAGIQHYSLIIPHLGVFIPGA